MVTENNDNWHFLIFFQCIYFLMTLLEQLQSVSSFKEARNASLRDFRRLKHLLGRSCSVWTLERVAHFLTAALGIDVGIHLQQFTAFQRHAFLELGVWAQ